MIYQEQFKRDRRCSPFVSSLIDLSRYDMYAAHLWALSTLGTIKITSGGIQYIGSYPEYIGEMLTTLEGYIDTCVCVCVCVCGGGGGGGYLELKGIAKYIGGTRMHCSEQFSLEKGPYVLWIAPQTIMIALNVLSTPLPPPNVLSVLLQSTDYLPTYAHTLY